MDFPGKEKIENMEKLAIIEKKIVEPTVRFSKKKKRLKLWIDWLKSKAKILFKQHLVFSGKEKIEILYKLAIIQGQNIVYTTVRFSRNKKRFKLLIDWL